MNPYGATEHLGIGLCVSENPLDVSPICDRIHQTVLDVHEVTMYPGHLRWEGRATTT